MVGDIEKTLWATADKLGELVVLISTIGIGDDASIARGILGQFYTLSSIAKSLAAMNLAIRGIDFVLGKEQTDIRTAASRPHRSLAHPRCAAT